MSNRQKKPMTITKPNMVEPEGLTIKSIAANNPV